MALEFLDLHPFVRDAAANKARGVVLGGALGDALGLYTEFLPQAEARRWYTEGIELGVTPLRGDSHRDKFLPGAWTDDTDHALLLVLSFLHFYNANQKAPSADDLAQDFAARLRSWCEQGLLALPKPPLGLGRTIATTALHPDYLADPHALARQKWTAVEVGEKPASNGSVMRTHPIGVMAVALSIEEAFELAAYVSTASHGDPRCTLACCTVVGVLHGLIRGEIANESDLDIALDAAKAWIRTKPYLSDPSHVTENNEDAKTSKDFLMLDEFDHCTHLGDFAPLELDDRQKIGYIYKCLGSGITTLRQAMRSTAPRHTVFKTLMTELVLQGGDADTNGSVAGALLGAWLGAEHLPRIWIDNMTDHAWLEDKNRRFVAATGIHDAEGDAAWKAQPRDADVDINGGREPLSKQERDERERSMVFAVIAKSKKRSEDEERAKQEQAKKWYRW